MIFRWFLFLFLSIVSKAIRGAKSGLPPSNVTIERSLRSNEDQRAKEMASVIPDGDIDILTSATMLDNKNGGFDACDESKCVSRGGSDLFEGFFTCYGDDIFFPKMCSDGFLPMLVDDEPPLLVSLMEFGVNSHVPLNYFTCCPPKLAMSPPNTTKATRHCSNPIISAKVNINNTRNSICEGQGDQIFAKPRQGFLIEPSPFSPLVRNFTFLGNGSFVCCDSTPTDYNVGISITTNSPNGVECVPYRNENYEVARPPTGFASCDFADEGFPFPRPIDGFDHATPYYRYQCCRDGPPMGPYVQDKAFKQFWYPRVVMSSIMAFVSLVLVAALLAPLLIQSKRKQFNVYNFMLLGLGFLDLSFAIFSVRNVSLAIDNRLSPMVKPPEYIDNGYNPGRMYLNMYVIGNMTLNCLMCHQIWVLLSCSRRAIRINPPSWTSMIVKILAVYFLTILAGVINLQVRNAARRMYYDGNVEKNWEILNFLYGSYWVYYGMVSGYVLCTSVLVWCCGYIPKATGTSPRDKALRELSIFFFRIVWVFVGIWVPGAILYLIGEHTGISWYEVVAAYTFQAQAIATFLVLLTKSDVKKYIVDLVTLSYLNCFCTTKSNNTTAGNNVAKEPPNIRQPRERSNRVSNITAATVDNTQKESLGLRLAEEILVRNSQDSETIDGTGDEETGVGLCDLKRITTQPPLTVSATGNAVPIASVQLAGTATLPQAND